MGSKSISIRTKADINPHKTIQIKPQGGQNNQRRPWSSSKFVPKQQTYIHDTFTQSSY